MTGLDKSLLLVILKSQLEIENAVLIALAKEGMVNASANWALKIATQAKVSEIKRQIKVLEEK